MTGIEVRPVDADRWDDLVELFGPSGAYSGCWCMWWRISGREFSSNGNAGNRAALRAVVAAGEPVGLLAYPGGRPDTIDAPVGWCAVAPRPAYPRVLRSPALGVNARLLAGARDGDPADPAVWAVTCFFIHRRHRRTGVAGALLAAAVTHARAAGATAIEGYPTDTRAGRPPAAAELYTGTVGLFERAGFTEVARPATGRRVIMSRSLVGSGSPTRRMIE